MAKRRSSILLVLCVTLLLLPGMALANEGDNAIDSTNDAISSNEIILNSKNADDTSDNNEAITKTNTADDASNANSTSNTTPNANTKATTVPSEEDFKDLPESPYKVIEGDNSVFIQKSHDTLSFRINGLFSNFNCLVVDRSIFPSENYTVTADSKSTVITLKNEYLSSLIVGMYKINIFFKNGYCTANFTVIGPDEITDKAESNSVFAAENVKPNNNISNTSKINTTPATGDNTPILAFISLLFSCIALIGYTVVVSRMKLNQQ